MQQNREHFRIKVNEIVKGQLICDNAPDTSEDGKVRDDCDENIIFEMEMVDISSGGMSAKTNQILKKGSTILIELPLDKDKYKVKGIIVKTEKDNFKRSGFIYRLQFANLSIECEHKISAYINKIQSNIMKERDLQAYDSGDTMSITDKILKEHGERRKKEDFLKAWPSIGSFVGWGMMVLIFVIIFAARPLAKDIISQLIGARTQLGWNVELLYKAYLASIALFLLSLISIVIDNVRQNRKDDFMHKPLMIQCILSLALILYFIQSLGIGQRGINK